MCDVEEKLPFVVTIDQGPADARKTLPIRAFVSAPDAVLPVQSAGPWMRVASYMSDLSEGATAMRIGIEAETYRWSAKRHVHCNSVDWPYMKRSLKTDKTLTITRENLQTQDVIAYRMWYGTPPNHDDPIIEEKITGKITVTEVFAEESTEVAVKVFHLLVKSREDDKPRIIAFGHRDLPMSPRSAAVQRSYP